MVLSELEEPQLHWGWPRKTSYNVGLTRSEKTSVMSTPKRP